MNGGPFMTYSSAVTLAANDDVVVRAYADPGYKFVKWETPAVQTASEVSFNNVASSLAFKVYFADNGSSGHSGNGLFLWILGIIFLLILAGLLLWFIIFCRRYYDVLKDSSSGIAGAERVHRKTEYRFSAERYSGSVSYRAGEDGQWKQLFPNEDGKYTVPRNEVTDDIYLEKRL